ncbi:putative metal-binding motif-containing protein [Corallococcus sp. CA047B]|uniref:putative metal-binding motif-containing protein n=1 Tax=Corallococcus sp. CA047B TaxID=2316729 RepID=UPI0011C464B8|nr:putative metal-binding motif-containing protein [Corallococcus sp. CA047B]
MICVVGGLLLGGCDSSPGPIAQLPDAGAGDAGVPEPLPCERTQGLCAGAKRALVDGVPEAVCTARSYGTAYEDKETRCDGLDNDCDGVTDPSTWTDVASLRWTPYTSMVDSLAVEGGFLVAASDVQGRIQIFRLDTALARVATTNVEVETGLIPATVTQLVRTSRGPALFYVTAGATAASTQGHLMQLDEQGVPVVRPEGGREDAILFEQPARYVPTRAGVSVDGSRVLTVWTSDHPVSGMAHELLGSVSDPSGQVRVTPQVLFQRESQDSALFAPAVLALDGGNFLVMAVEDHGFEQNAVIRLRRYDRDLSPMGEGRTLSVGYSPMPVLLRENPVAEGIPGEPILLLRDVSGGNRKLLRVRALFDNGAPETLVERMTTAPGEAPWFSATMTSRGLQATWLSVQYDYSLPNGSLYNGQGRLWGRSPAGVVTDWTPGPGLLPLHRQQEWVLMHELPDQWMGALLMTATDDPPTHTLKSLRYCAP